MSGRSKRETARRSSAAGRRRSGVSGESRFSAGPVAPFKKRAARSPDRRGPGGSSPRDAVVPGLVAARSPRPPRSRRAARPGVAACRGDAASRVRPVSPLARRRSARFPAPLHRTPCRPGCGFHAAAPPGPRPFPRAVAARCPPPFIAAVSGAGAPGARKNRRGPHFPLASARASVLRFARRPSFGVPGRCHGVRSGCPARRATLFPGVAPGGSACYACAFFPTPDREEG